MVQCLIFMVIFSFGVHVFAFDPTTVAMSAHAISGVMGGLDKADEIAGIGFALGDLLGDLGGNKRDGEDIDRAIKRIQDISDKAKDLNWSKNEIISAIDSDLAGASSIQEKIQAIKRMIDASKKIAAIMQVRPKAGEKAAQIQEIKINSMILEELQAMRKTEYIRYLNEKQSAVKREVYLQKVSAVSESRGLKAINENVLAACLSLFRKVSFIVSSLVGTIVMMRFTFLLVRFGSPGEYGAVLIDAVVYFGLVMLYPILVQLIIDLTGTLSHQIAYIPLSAAQRSVEEFFSSVLSESIVFRIFGKIGDALLMVTIQAIYSLLIALMIAIGPIMIFLTTIMNLSKGLSSYFLVFISLCLWPTLWNILGALGRELFPYMQSSPVSAPIFWIVVQIAQLLSPIVCAYLFQSFSSIEAVTKSVKGAIKVASNI